MTIGRGEFTQAMQSHYSQMQRMTIRIQDLENQVRRLERVLQKVEEEVWRDQVFGPIEVVKVDKEEQKPLLPSEEEMAEFIERMHTCDI